MGGLKAEAVSLGWDLQYSACSLGVQAPGPMLPRFTAPSAAPLHPSAGPDLLHFCLVFSLVFVGYAMLAHLIFGNGIEVCGALRSGGAAG